MVFAYGDESMDETKQRVCAVAAVIGTEEHWKAIEEKWMERNRGIPFHAKDCDVNPGRGDYANRTHDENKNLYRDLAIMLAESGLYGAGVAVDIQAQRDAFPDADAFIYYRPFLHIIGFLQSMAQSRPDIVEITFDARLETDHNAAFLYASFREDNPEWKDHLASKISFESDTDNPRIQVADLLARESMKALDNMIGPVKRKERKSWNVLRSTGRFSVTAWSHELYQDMKAKIPLMNEALGFTQEEYFAWLAQKRRQHNTTNSFQFLTERISPKEFAEKTSKLFGKS